MDRRVLALAFSIACLALRAPALAAPPPGATDSDARVSALNNRLQAIATTTRQPHGGFSQQPAGAPAFAQPTSASARLLAPALLNAAARFTTAERLLHFQSHGLDANFWGAFNGGRGMHVRYVIHF